MKDEADTGEPKEVQLAKWKQAGMLHVAETEGKVLTYGTPGNPKEFCKELLKKIKEENDNYWNDAFNER